MNDRHTWQAGDLQPADMIPIPEHLLLYNPSDWMGKVEPSVRFPDLRARELQRQAQDRWSQSVGIWRDTFEQWHRAQLAAHRQENP